MIYARLSHNCPQKKELTSVSPVSFLVSYQFIYQLFTDNQLKLIDSLYPDCLYFAADSIWWLFVAGLSRMIRVAAALENRHFDSQLRKRSIQINQLDQQKVPSRLPCCIVNRKAVGD
jgi:hypothetical protein